jgi:hypothetical protein
VVCMEPMGEPVAAHDATLRQMHARLSAIRMWLMALMALQAAQVGSLIAILVRQ